MNAPDRVEPGTARPKAGLDEEAREIAVVIEFARQRVEETSLRRIAQEIGMSATGLRGVLDGSGIYDRTRTRLRAWFAWQKGSGEISPKAAENTLLSLVRRLPRPHAAAAEVLELVSALHVHAAVEAPDWIDEVRSRLRQVNH